MERGGGEGGRGRQPYFGQLALLFAQGLELRVKALLLFEEPTLNCLVAAELVCQ